MFNKGSITEREGQILKIIKENTLISQDEIVELLGIKRSSVGVHISNLTKKGYLKGKGYIVNEEKYVVVIGGSNLDIAGFPKNNIIDNDSNPGVIKTSSGGVGRNIAENMARLGMNTVLISAIGYDGFGSSIIDDCVKAGINMEYVIRSQQYSTSTYMCIMDTNKDMNIAISEMDIVNEIDIDTIEKRDAVIANAHAIVLDANISQETIDYVLETYNYIPIFADTVSSTKATKFNSKLDKIYSIKPNLLEARVMLSKEEDNAESIVDILLKEMKAKGIALPIISSGNDGVYYLVDDTVHNQKSMSNNPLNTTGGGDAFMAGLVYSYFTGKASHDAIKIASIVSMIAIECESTINKTLTADKVNHLFDQLIENK